MSALRNLYLNGHYDDEGRWQRTKFCFMQCAHCDCGPPGGLYYSVAHDKRLDEKSDTYKPSHGGYPNKKD